MSNPMVRIYTDSENFIDREMNADELLQWEKDKVEAEAQIAHNQVKAEAKEAVLAKLGLTADEVAALLA